MNNEKKLRETLTRIATDLRCEDEPGNFSSRRAGWEHSQWAKEALAAAGEQTKAGFIPWIAWSGIGKAEIEMHGPQEWCAVTAEDNESLLDMWALDLSPDSLKAVHGQRLLVVAIGLEPPPQAEEN